MKQENKKTRYTKEQFGWILDKASEFMKRELTSNESALLWELVLPCYNNFDRIEIPYDYKYPMIYHAEKIIQKRKEEKLRKLKKELSALEKEDI